MAFERITEDDLQGKGNLGRPDTPGVDTTEMQRILDELPREVIVPAFNRLAEQLEAADAAASLGARPPEGLPEDTPATAQGVLEAMQAGAAEHAARTDNPHAVTAAQTGAYTKAETEEAIGRRVVEIGAGDMAQAVYDPARLGVDVTVQTYTHTRSGTVHNFAGSGANGRALMTADVQAGDTFAVNGEPVTAYMGTESAAGAMAGSQWNGRWVSFVFDGETLNFKGGGGLPAADRAKLIPGNIKAGVTFFEGTPRAVAGTFTADADAGAADLLSGRTAYVNGEKVTGSIPSKAAATYTPAAADQTIEAGQYLSGAQTVRGDANLKAENIKQGASIFGVAGALKLLYAGGCKTGTYAGGVRWNGASYVYEGHSYFYLTGQPKTLYVQYEATPYVKVDGKTYGPGQHDISSAKANCYVEYGDTGSRAGICILGV
ncbi:hypothetical protein [Candidatus Allofournierella excrementavium]|uniref:hypothetical protein n=1 Tax=Candidatus Allofournierella excrementavium TaxID=2838591 RepID=UPI003AF6B52E